MRRKRWRLASAALIAALLIILHPPWRARAIRRTTRYMNLVRVEPLVLIDTLEWSVSFSPLYARPRTPFTEAEMTRVAERALRGDRVARSALIAMTDRFEQRYGVPDVLRASGSLWRDSVLAAAGMPSISGYEVSFAIDAWRLTLRLALITFLGAIAYILRLRRVARQQREWDH